MKVDKIQCSVFGCRGFISQIFTKFQFKHGFTHSIALQKLQKYLTESYSTEPST